MMIERVEEDRIDIEDTKAVADLLRRSFPGYFAGRLYFKQRPHFRLLARRNDDVVGHAAIVLRAARLGETPISIFGLADLCVAEEQRNEGIGAALTGAFLAAACSAHADFAILFADDPRLYTMSGFTRAANLCTWLATDDHHTLGIRTEPLADCLMTMRLGSMQWDENAAFDLLGHVF